MSLPSFVRAQLPAPDDFRVRLLTAFCEWPYPQARREAEVRAFGDNGYTATWAASMVRELREAGYIELAPLSDRKFVATGKGHAMLGVLRACDQAPGGGAA